ncbi:hypothetical protein [Zhongshania aliphaticivorans]|uniref:hypothetical protein n=1 Tax=Zhongshania aliphaticivorans TaxID=1470434 RepID=UPI0012E5B1D1|nr:hypothetical protein [Zhongshania aliphaticivorans]CAA0103640.1 Uncharacterised protein [Zhongshania aliphaticivorans]
MSILMMLAGVSTPVGQQAYTTGSAHSFIVPSGVYLISVVAVGQGGGTGGGTGGAGGALVWRNNIAVTPGETLSINILSDALIQRGATILLKAKAAINNFAGTLAGSEGYDAGYSGAAGTASYYAGGAGKYTANGDLSPTSYKGGSGIDLLGDNTYTPGASSPNGGVTGGAGADFGGGAGRGFSTSGAQGKAGLRIIWGPDRAYPSTNTGDM